MCRVRERGAPNGFPVAPVVACLLPNAGRRGSEHGAGYVLWKEFSPLIRQLMPLPEGREGQQHSLAGCYVAIVGMFADILGWAFNPSYLPVLHEYMHHLAVKLDGMVRLLA
jgi:hypothetical protein